jgi:hypothetical protein
MSVLKRSRVERARSADPWTGLSEDVIRRFFDVLCIEQGLPKGMLSAYRADLDAFDRWLIEAKHKTLITPWIAAKKRGFCPLRCRAAPAALRRHFQRTSGLTAGRMARAPGAV